MPYVEFHRIILAATLAVARIGAVFMVCPVMTESMIPGLARRAVVVALGFVAFPMVLAQMPEGEPDLALCALVALKEAAIGFVIGFFSAVPFWIAENVGNFIDNQRGATMGEVYSPLNGAQASSTGLFFSQVAATLFFVGGAVFVLLTAVYASFGIWPVFGGEWFRMTPDAPRVVLGTVDGMVRTTVVVASPVILVMFLATLGLGFVNRTAPQLNVFFLSMPVKSALGLAFLVVYLPYVLDMLMYGGADSILAPVRRTLM